MIRKANIEELAVVSRFRYQMFVEIGTAHLFVDDFIEKTIAAYSTDYQNGTCLHFVEEIDGIIVGCAGGRISRNEIFRNPIQGCIMDVYVERFHRRNGIATRLTEKIIEWLRVCGAETIKLHAAIAAVPIYEQLGFENSREMKLAITSERSVEQSTALNCGRLAPPL